MFYCLHNILYFIKYAVPKRRVTSDHCINVALHPMPPIKQLKAILVAMENATLVNVADHRTTITNIVMGIIISIVAWNFWFVIEWLDYIPT
ncbi:hypothetical protein L596_030861 [Steinernema carpocapsae]|uniref:Uncharacterized protein n=1 Tax=Steinernema carpocapsae TaxID=34508 RepID=A0A4V5ZWT8_STECR|nr:hypothetical protein L596_030861 [Steinernema carpocapsae]